jgi:hypothetical protein
MADIRTFWGALLSVLLKCLAALGFAPAARSAARPQTPVAPAVPAAPTAVAVAAAPADARGSAHKEASAEAPAGGALPALDGGTETAAQPAPPRRRRSDAHVPAPRAATESRLNRRNRGRTLPPTMKQRISAEAHGATPSARSLPAELDPYGLNGLGALADLAVAGSGSTRADDLALCA